MENYNCDFLVFAAHPDDAELAIGGLITRLTHNHKKVVIADLTQGQLGTRGTPQIRMQEAIKAADILKLTARENCQLNDGFFTDDQPALLKLIEVIRKYRPRIVLANAEKDRHPDHGRAANLAEKACFMAGLSKVSSVLNHVKQAPHRPESVFHYIQDYYIEPDIVFDVTPYWPTKMEAIKAYSTQFFTGQQANDHEPETPISTPDFIFFLEARAREFGRPAKVTFAEGLTCRTPISADLLKHFF